MPGIALKVIKAIDDPIPTWDENMVLKAGEIGEIVVKGPMVTRSYLNRPVQTSLAKIPEGHVCWVWMGVVGCVVVGGGFVGVRNIECLLRKVFYTRYNVKAFLTVIQAFSGLLLWG